MTSTGTESSHPRPPQSLKHSNVARVALWGGSRLGAGWFPRLEHFLAEWWLGISFSGSGVQANRLRRSYCGRSLFLRNQAGSRNLWLWLDVRERHELRSLMARNSTEPLGGDYDLESSRSAVSCTSLTWSQSTFQASTSVVLCLF